MNLATSLLASRGVLPRATEKKRKKVFKGREGVEKRKLFTKIPLF